jgi:hypothetical protein
MVSYSTNINKFRQSDAFICDRFFNDQEVKNTPKTKLESKQNTHTLTLPKAELTDEGVYKCIATNPDGTIETKAHISVCSMFLKTSTCPL